MVYRVLYTHCPSFSINRFGFCGVCREVLDEAWPIYLDNHDEINQVRHADNPVHHAADIPVRNAAVPRIQLERLQFENLQAVAAPRPVVQIIVLPDPERVRAIQPQANVQRPQSLNRRMLENRRRRAAIRRRRAAIRRRQRNFPHFQYRYVPPMGRVRNRLQASFLTYNLLRCVVCRRVFHTNEYPAMPTNEIICSIDCFHRM